MNKLLEAKKRKIFNEINELIKALDEHYFQEYKRMKDKKENRVRYKIRVYDKKHQRWYPSITEASIVIGHTSTYIKKHKELFVLEANKNV